MLFGSDLSNPFRQFENKWRPYRFRDFGVDKLNLSHHSPRMVWRVDFKLKSRQFIILSYLAIYVLIYKWLKD